jgi:hypothetical protein
MKRLLAALALFIAASSTSFAQYNWTTWAYPTSTTATTNVGSGTVNLTVSGTNSGSVDTADFPVKYQGTPFTQLTGDAVGAQNFGTTSFQMQLNFIGFTSTAGLVLAIGNIGHGPAYSGYGMTAFNASNNSIPISAFGQLGNFDYTWTATNDMFNDNLSLANNGKFNVMTVTGQNDQNSDMLLLSLPAGVDRIFVNLQVPTEQAPDTINFMVAPVPEASSVSLFLLGGAAVAFIAYRRKILNPT